ncbi:hypothetical protein OIU85_004851 [Salix viminalis]|uniref:Uncharacterized protein n=1 Tax=Salix viminalis TaxID=40686 RepID=A0A9Q0PTP0_SALVM|nr:hypothetical protein OIU85_004851 [Salix viminalis]
MPYIVIDKLLIHRLRVHKRVGLSLYINSEMNKISNMIVFMLLHGLMILSPPNGGTHMAQAYDTADRQAAELETTSSRNWNFPRKLKVEKLKGIKIMLGLDSDRQSGAVKIASTKHLSAEVNVEPQRFGRPKPPSPKPNVGRSYFKPPAGRDRPRKYPPPPPMSLYCRSCR